MAEYHLTPGRILARKMFGYHGRKGPGLPDLQTRGGLLYYTYDGIGNVSLLTDRLGEVVYRYRYDAYGGLLTGATAPYNLYGPFGKEYDPVSGLVYFGARWYDASVGRFTTPDPFPGTITDPLTLVGWAGLSSVRICDVFERLHSSLARKRSRGSEWRRIELGFARKCVRGTRYTMWGRRFVGGLIDAGWKTDLIAHSTEWSGWRPRSTELSGCGSVLGSGRVALNSWGSSSWARMNSWKSVNRPWASWSVTMVSAARRSNSNHRVWHPLSIVKAWWAWSAPTRNATMISQLGL